MTVATSELAVDIVIDNFNYGRFLPDAIESACAQTHGRVRVIVVDDGSTDESRALLRDYEDRVEVVLKENGGQASAFNVGAARCEGDVLMFLDADDTLRPDAAARVAAVFAAEEDVVKVQFRTDVIDADGNPTGAVKPAEHLPMPSGDVGEDELAQPYDLVWMATSANAFRTEALRRILPIPEEAFRTCADWYLVHLTALLGRVVSLDEISGSYRLHGANSYEPQRPEVDLDHLHETIRFSIATSAQLLQLADRLQRPHPDRILSLADLANRMISLRLEPGRHPIETDTRRGLVHDAIRAARRRSNVSAAMKLIFVFWFALMAVAPRRLARSLARFFLFPQSRSALNRVLGRLQRPGAEATTPG